jgi:hypothetical protein
MEMMYDLLIRDGGRELFYQPLGGYFTYNFDFFRKNMQHPNVLFGLSDGGAHCGVIADAGMPTFILTHWARDRTKGEQLPAGVPGAQAQQRHRDGLRPADRGELRPGLLADVNVIDFERLRLFRPEAIYDLPAGGKRLVQRVDGYRYTVKSGQVTFEDGQSTGALPGSLVRGGREARILNFPLDATLRRGGHRPAAGRDRRRGVRRLYAPGSTRAADLPRPAPDQRRADRLRPPLRPARVRDRADQQRPRRRLGAARRRDDDVVKVLKGNMGWHCDSTYMPVQAKGAVFSAHVVPDAGGETGWADMRAAYDALDAGDAARGSRTLSAYHSLRYSQASSATTRQKPRAGYSGYGFDVDRAAAAAAGEDPSRDRPQVPDHRPPRVRHPGPGAGRVRAPAGRPRRVRLPAAARLPPQLDARRRGGLGQPRLMHRACPWDMTQPRVMYHSRIAGDPVSEAAAAFQHSR